MTQYDFNIAHYFNWTYDPTIQTKETEYFQIRFNEKYHIAEQLKDYVKSVVEINCGNGHYFAMLLTAIRNIHYLGITNHEAWRKFTQNETDSWIAMHNAHDHNESYSRIILSNPNTISNLPSGPVSLVLVHGTTVEETYHNLYLANKIGSFIWVTNARSPSTIEAIQKFEATHHIFDTIWCDTTDGECLLSCDDLKTVQISGDFGDAIAAMSLCKQWGTVNLNFVSRPYTREPMTAERLNVLKELLEEQHYIAQVEFREDPNAIDLDIWRNSAKWRKSIPGALEEAFNTNSLTVTPWIECPEKNYVSDTIFCRSLRYHNSDPMWPKLYKIFPDAVFCGLESEYEAMKLLCPGIKWYKTNNLLELAMVFKAAKQICVNQTAAFWLAASMHKDIVLEEDVRVKNCFTEALNIIKIKTDNAIELDHVKELRFWF